MSQFGLAAPDSFLNPKLINTFGGQANEMLEKQTSTWWSNFSVFWHSLKIYFAVHNRLGPSSILKYYSILSSCFIALF
jgi:hypothetical protein